MSIVDKMNAGLLAGQRMAQKKENDRIKSLMENISTAQQSPDFDLTSSADFKTLAAVSPQTAQSMGNVFSGLSKERQQRYVSTMMQAKSALEMGNLDGAKDHLDRQIIKVREQGGDPSNSAYVRKMLDQDPQAAYNGLMSMEKTLSQQGQLNMDPTIANRQNRRVQSTDHQDGGSLLVYSDGQTEFKPYSAEHRKKLNEWRKSHRPDLSAGQITQIMEYQKSAKKSLRMADEAGTLKAKIDSMDISSGMLAKGSELWKRVWGDEDKVSAIRRDYTRIKNEFVVNSLPPGIASDRDIQLINDGFFDDTANPEQLSNFLGALSRMQQDVALNHEFKAAFMELSGGMQTSDRDFTYKGVKMPEGVSVDEAYEIFVESKFGGKEEEQPKPLPNANNNQGGGAVINWADMGN